MPEKKAQPKPVKTAEDYVEELLGVHPKYLIFTYNQVTVDLWNLEHDGKRFNGFTPYRKSIGEVD